MYGGYRRKRSLIRRLIRRLTRQECNHVWQVHGASTSDTSLHVVCEICGGHGTVPEPSETEWNAAFELDGKVVSWPDGDSVIRNK